MRTWKGGKPRGLEQNWQLLIGQIAKEDQRALATLYDATSSLVYGLAMRILGNVSMAEEVTLDVYTQVWRQAAAYDPQRGTPSAWLFTLTRSRAIDRLRSRAQEHRQTALDTVETMPAPTLNPEESSLTAERQRWVHTAFTALVPEQREVIELAYFSGLSHREIAARIGQPLGTVKTRIRLGMSKLRELLRPLIE